MLQDSFNPYCYLLSTFFVSPRTNHIFLKVTSIRPLPEVVGIPVAAFVIQLLASGLGKAAEAGPIACASAPTWKTWKKILPMSLEQISSGWSLQPFVEWTCIWKASHCLSFYKTFFEMKIDTSFLKNRLYPIFPFVLLWAYAVKIVFFGRPVLSFYLAVSTPAQLVAPQLMHPCSSYWTINMSFIFLPFDFFSQICCMIFQHPWHQNMLLFFRKPHSCILSLFVFFYLLTQRQQLFYIELSLSNFIVIIRFGFLLFYFGWYNFLCKKREQIPLIFYIHLFKDSLFLRIF